jgi:glucose-1-phosphate thymidylyltransferase
MEYFKDYNDIKITYVSQDKQLGTAHALLQAKNKIKSSFIVLSGDNIIDQKSISNLVKTKEKYSILIKEHPNQSKYGAVFLEKNKLKKIVEKPAEDFGKFISTGIYKLPKTVFIDIKKLTSKGIYDLSSLIDMLLKQNITINTVTADIWMDIVYPWDLLSVNEAMLLKTKSSKAGTIEKNVIIKGNVSIGKETKIYSGCYIVGPVKIGKGCEIGPNVCIFPSTSVGDNSTIHPFTEISNSVVMNDVHIGSNSFISNSVISKGTILNNNFSSSKGEKIVKIEDEYKEIKNIGALIGEDCLIKNHVVVDPGIIIGRKCEIDSMKRIRKDIESKSKVM